MLSASAEKLQRIRSFLDTSTSSGLVLMRQDNFAWLSTGGTNRVIIPAAEGAAALVITKDQLYLVAHRMDGQRIMDEEMHNLPTAEHVPVHWDEGSVLSKAIEMAGKSPAADVPCSAALRTEEIYDLHYPLFDCEIAVLEEAGRIADAVLSDVAHQLTPEHTEQDAARMLRDALLQRGAECDVVLIGGEDRVFRYRHPTPTQAPIGRYVLITPSIRYRGLHCNIARSLCFGSEVPAAVRKAYDAASTASASSAALTQEGTSYRHIFEAYRQVLDSCGFDGEWRNHFPGGRIGYMVCQPGFSLDPSRAIGKQEAFEWFATVPGAKAAELIIKDGKTVYNASAAGHWPMRSVHIHGRDILMPEIMMR